MKAKTYIKPNVYVYFAYETYDGWDKFGKYKDAKDFNVDDYGQPLPLYLCGYLVNEYYGSDEKINEKMIIHHQPTISEIKQFITNCYDCVAPKQKVWESQ